MNWKQNTVARTSLYITLAAYIFLTKYFNDIFDQKYGQLAPELKMLAATAAKQRLGRSR
jgi:hypothetical protein